MEFRLFTTLLFCLLTTISFSQFWEQVDDFPGLARDDGSTFTIGDKHYCGLGRDLGFNCTRDFYVFNGATSTWSTSTSLPINEERQYATGASWNGKGIIFGGAKCDGSFVNDLWFFDPITSLWTEMSPLPAAGRGGAVHIILEDTLYVVGGRNSTGILSEVWGYDLSTDVWSPKMDIPGNGIWRGLSFHYNGIGYAGLGKNNLSAQTEFNTEIYSFNGQTWNLMPSLGLSERAYIGNAQSDSLVFLFGGIDPTNSILTSFDRIDIANWTIHSLPPFSSVPRKGTMCFLENDIFYMTTGVSQTERFDETWRINGILDQGELSANSATLFPNPSAEQCRIQFITVPSEPLFIYAVDGTLIQQYSILNSDFINLDLNALTNGIYFVRCGSIVQRLEIIK